MMIKHTSRLSTFEPQEPTSPAKPQSPEASSCEKAFQKTTDKPAGAAQICRGLWRPEKTPEANLADLLNTAKNLFFYGKTGEAQEQLDRFDHLLEYFHSQGVQLENANTLEQDRTGLKQAARQDSPPPTGEIPPSVGGVISTEDQEAVSDVGENPQASARPIYFIPKRDNAADLSEAYISVRNYQGASWNENTGLARKAERADFWEHHAPKVDGSTVDASHESNYWLKIGDDGRAYIPHPTGYQVLSAKDSEGRSYPVFQNQHGDFFVYSHGESEEKSLVHLSWTIAPTEQGGDASSWTASGVDWVPHGTQLSSFQGRLKNAGSDDETFDILLGLEDHLKKTRDYQAQDPFLPEAIYQASSCDATAIIFADLVSAAGLPVRKVTGFAPGGTAHAWNEVAVGGKWYRFDATPPNRQQDFFALENSVDVPQISKPFDIAEDYNYSAPVRFLASTLNIVPNTVNVFLGLSELAMNSVAAGHPGEDLDALALLTPLPIVALRPDKIFDHAARGVGNLVLGLNYLLEDAGDFYHSHSLGESTTELFSVKNYELAGTMVLSFLAAGGLARLPGKIRARATTPRIDTSALNAMVDGFKNGQWFREFQDTLAGSRLHRTLEEFLGQPKDIARPAPAPRGDMLTRENTATALEPSPPHPSVGNYRLVERSEADLLNAQDSINELLEVTRAEMSRRGMTTPTPEFVVNVMRDPLHLDGNGGIIKLGGQFSRIEELMDSILSEMARHLSERASSVIDIDAVAVEASPTNTAIRPTATPATFEEQVAANGRVKKLLDRDQTPLISRKSNSIPKTPAPNFRPKPNYNFDPRQYFRLEEFHPLRPNFLDIQGLIFSQQIVSYSTLPIQAVLSGLALLSAVSEQREEKKVAD